jgi:4-hydroxybenzoate polyprenyltransferase
MVHIHNPTHNIKHTDIQKQALVYRLMPAFTHHYINLMRLDRPVGIYLLFLPCLWGVLIGRDLLGLAFLDIIPLIILLAIGSVIMRGAGCIINDLWDIQIDRAVERTKLRPLASGSLSTQNALIFLSVLLGLGLIILLQLPTISIALGFFAMIPIILYPVAKRVTWYPQLVLGFTFNMGVLIAGSTLLPFDNIHSYLPLFLVYISAVFWTFGYDTVYAHQDIDDDARIGVKSSALKFGGRSFEWVLGFYMIMAFGLAACLWILPSGFASWGFYLLGMGYVLWNHFKWDAACPADSLFRFKSHILAGLLIAGAFYA